MIKDKGLTLDEIKQDPEIIRLNELMRTTANSINQRLTQLFKENEIQLEVPLFEALIYGNVNTDLAGQ